MGSGAGAEVDVYDVFSVGVVFLDVGVGNVEDLVVAVIGVNFIAVEVDVAGVDSGIQARLCCGHLLCNDLRWRRGAGRRRVYYN